MNFRATKMYLLKDVIIGKAAELAKKAEGL